MFVLTREGEFWRHFYHYIIQDINTRRLRKQAGDDEKPSLWIQIVFICTSICMKGTPGVCVWVRKRCDFKGRSIIWRRSVFSWTCMISWIDVSGVHTITLHYGDHGREWIPYSCLTLVESVRQVLTWGTKHPIFAAGLGIVAGSTDTNSVILLITTGF